MTADREVRYGWVRAARAGDAQELFGLLALCFAEYPGCFVDPHADLADLLAPEAAFGPPGAFWVAEDEGGRICACVAVDVPDPATAELHRLYVRPDRRGQGLGVRLVRLAEEHGRTAGCRHMVFWSDTRFETAHRLYERLGYRSTGETRELGDVSHSTEYRYEKPLGPDQSGARGEPP